PGFALRDRHGLGSPEARCALRAASGGALRQAAGRAARQAAVAKREAALAGDGCGPTAKATGTARRRWRRALDPIEPDSAAVVLLCLLTSSVESVALLCGAHRPSYRRGLELRPI